MLVKNKHEAEMKEVKAKLAEAETALAETEKALVEAKKGEEVEKEVKDKESVMLGCGRGVKNSAELKAQLAVLPRLQEELAKRDAEASDLRGAQQGLQTKYGELEQKYASCLSEGTKLKQE